MTIDRVVFSGLFWIVAMAIGHVPVHAADFAKNFGTAGFTTLVSATSVDASGNVYIAGAFDGATLDIGNVTLARIGDIDAFVAKLDSSGNAVWARNYGGPGAVAVITGVANDGIGAPHLVGIFGNARLTVPALTPLGIRDAFALKLDGAGTTVWARNFGGFGTTMISGRITVEGSGNTLFTGETDDDLTRPPLSRIGLKDVFAVKLDGAGNTIWGKRFGGMGIVTNMGGIAADGSGNVFLAGDFESRAGASLTVPPLSKIGNQDVFAVKLGPSGSTIWAKSFGGTSANLWAPDIAVDGSGSAFLLAGLYNGNLTQPPLARTGEHDMVAMKLDASGATSWAKGFGGSGQYAYPNVIAVDGQGNAFIGGELEGNLTKPPLTLVGKRDGLAIRLDASGNVTWARSFGGTNASTYASTLAVDGAGTIYQGGTFENASLTTPPLARKGLADGFIIKQSTPTSSSTNYTALWWNPAESGWGMNLNHQASTIFATLFTYARDGNALWLVASNLAQQPDGSFSGALYRTSGPPFYQVPWTSISYAEVGSMTLRFTSATAGTLTYSFDGATLTKSIVREEFASPVPTCTSETGSRSSLTNYQDLWWNPAESGWGINLTHQGNIVFAALFTYTASGRDGWMVATNMGRQADGSFTGPLYVTTGPPFDTAPWRPITATPVGAMTLRFSSGEAGTLSYTANGINVTKNIVRQAFGSTVPFCR